jgi:hypothetical protein
MVAPGVAWPQQITRIPRIGVLWHAGNEEEEKPYLTALRGGFRDIGHVEGKTFVPENRFPDEQPEGFISMASELAALPSNAALSAG